MLPLRAIACVVALTAVLLTGCGIGGGTSKAVRTLAVTIEPEKKTRTIEVKPLTQVDITLPPTEGEQVWQISFHDARVLRQISEIVPASTPGGGAKVSFVTVDAGRILRTRVRFHLFPRSGAREIAPLDEQELVLNIP